VNVAAHNWMRSQSEDIFPRGIEALVKPGTPALIVVGTRFKSDEVFLI
jgi:hypothetical protein